MTQGVNSIIKNESVSECKETLQGKMQTLACGGHRWKLQVMFMSLIATIGIDGWNSSIKNNL